MLILLKCLTGRKDGLNLQSRTGGFKETFLYVDLSDLGLLAYSRLHISNLYFCVYAVYTLRLKILGGFIVFNPLSVSFPSTHCFF